MSINNEEGAVKATNYLIKKGTYRIAHIMGPETLQISRLRLEGYKEALKKKIALDNELVKTVDLLKRRLKKALRELMKLNSPPTAIFTFKNYNTLDAIEFEKKYPDKLDLTDFTDFGNLSLFDYSEKKPPASIEENFMKSVKQAAILLFKMVN